jgi:triosephosphate isomerase
MRGLVIGNWKMNGTVEESLKLITDLKNRLEGPLAVDVAVAPPFTALYSVYVILQETPFKLVAQDSYWEAEGAYTGEISPVFLKDVGCTYVLIGHSERRRYFGETDEMVNRKVEAAISSELAPVLCIGETAEERKRGQTEPVLERQLKKGLRGLHLPDLEDFVIAYEPVWAIGTGETARTEQIEAAHLFIRDYLAKNYDAPTANEIRILYGGSVNPQNAKEIYHVRHVDGLLVGGASLSAEKFASIVRAKEA